MSLAEEIAPHLPYLRRFARALAGSQDSGDAYVSATLEAVIQDPSILDLAMDSKAALFSAFLKIWRSVELSDTGAGDDVTIAERRLDTLPPQRRQAFLLVGLEGFNRRTAAQIMGVEGVMLDALITEAGEEIAAQIATSVLIIEDEPLIAMDLEEIVRSLGHDVAGIARTHEDAVRIAEKTRPGLVLADVQLADGSSGLEAVNVMLKTNNTPVIFITAFPERLLTGERPEPAFLISKPFQPITVRAVISQALFFDQKAGTATIGA